MLTLQRRAGLKTVSKWRAARKRSDEAINNRCSSIQHVHINIAERTTFRIFLSGIQNER